MDVVLARALLPSHFSRREYLFHLPEYSITSLTIHSSNPLHRIFWVISTLVSWYTLRYSNNNGFLPGYESLGNHPNNIDPDKAAFSTSMAPHDEEAYAPVNMEDQNDGRSHSPYNADSYGGSSTGGGAMFDADTSYRPQNHSPPPQDNPFDSGYRVNNLTPLNDSYLDSYNGPASSSYGGSVGASKIYAPPADDYDSNAPVQFPSANYDRTMH